MNHIIIILIYLIYAQIILATDERLQVFFECPNDCPKNKIINEIKFVDFINGKKDADVHVKVDIIDISQNMIQVKICYIMFR